MAQDLLVKVCSSRGEQIHLVLDKYQFPSIKDCEQKFRGGDVRRVFVITGPDQAQRQSGTEQLKNGAFKEEFARFLMQEWRNPQYGSIIGNKTVYFSHGGKCMAMKNDENFLLQVDEPDLLQVHHKDDDKLIAFHTSNITSGNIVVRSSDTDVIIMIARYDIQL